MSDLFEDLAALAAAVLFGFGIWFTAMAITAQGAG